MIRIAYQHTDSTNRQARRHLARNPGQRALITAAEQSAGRGRRERPWASPRGGAWLSLIWPMSGDPSANAATPLAAALAVCDALAGPMAGVQTHQLRIKWPNDVLLNGRKVAGILCEQVPEHAAVIVGVGVNADFEASELPSKIRFPATTLRTALRRRVAVPELIHGIADALSDRLTALERSGPGPIVGELGKCLAFAGETVRVTLADRCVSGDLLGLDRVGRLRLHTLGGELRLDHGDVQRVRPHEVPPPAQRPAGGASVTWPLSPQHPDHALDPTRQRSRVGTDAERGEPDPTGLAGAQGDDTAPNIRT